MTRAGRALLGAAAGIALAAGYSTTVRADLPVIDTAAVGQLAHQLANDIKAYGLQLQQYAGEVKSWATQNLQWLQQLQQYSVQLQQYTNELTMLQNWVRNPSLGAAMGLLNIAGLGSSLPVNAYAVLNLVNGRSYGASGLPEISGVLLKPVEPDRGRLRGQPCLHPDRCQLGQPGADLEREQHRRRARCRAGGLHRFAGPRGGAPGAARPSRDCQLAQGRAGHPGADRARDRFGPATRPHNSRRSTRPMPRNGTLASSRRTKNWQKTSMLSPATRPPNSRERRHYDAHISAARRCRRDRLLLRCRARRDCVFGGTRPTADGERGHPAGPNDAAPISCPHGHVVQGAHSRATGQARRVQRQPRCGKHRC